MKKFFSTHLPLAIAAAVLAAYFLLAVLSPGKWVKDHVGSIGIGLVCILVVLLILWPTNWRFIKVRYFGVVVRFGRIIPDIRGEGPQHILAVFGDRLIEMPAHDQPFELTFKLLTGGETPQDVEVTFVIVLKLNNPIATVTNVPRHEPLVAFRSQLLTAARSAVQSVTIDDLLQINGGKALSMQVAESLRQNPLLGRWGIELVQSEVADINPSPDVTAASMKRYTAKADADAGVTAAEGEVKAVRLQREGQGDEMFLKLEELQTVERMADKGAFQTLMTLGGITDAIGGLFGRNVGVNPRKEGKDAKVS